MDLNRGDGTAHSFQRTAYLTVCLSAGLRSDCCPWRYLSPESPKFGSLSSRQIVHSFIYCLGFFRPRFSVSEMLARVQVQLTFPCPGHLVLDSTHSHRSAAVHVHQHLQPWVYRKHFSEKCHKSFNTHTAVYETHTHTQTFILHTSTALLHCSYAWRKYQIARH